ncbi:MAG TPA: hypothetical protein DEP84_28825 [Chloroflexi bacterium]|nr:hypothetical protein [Chloroflexota bacterium]
MLEGLAAERRAEPDGSDSWCASALESITTHLWRVGAMLFLAGSAGRYRFIDFAIKISSRERPWHYPGVCAGVVRQMA